MDLTVCTVNSSSKKKGRKIYDNFRKYCDNDPNITTLRTIPRPCKHDNNIFKCNKVSYSDILENRIQLY